MMNVIKILQVWFVKAIKIGKKESELRDYSMKLKYLELRSYIVSDRGAPLLKAIAEM